MIAENILDSSLRATKAKDAENKDDANKETHQETKYFTL
jgi:hypothetical protein